MRSASLKELTGFSPSDSECPVSRAPFFNLLKLNSDVASLTTFTDRGFEVSSLGIAPHFEITTRIASGEPELGSPTGNDSGRTEHEAHGLRALGILTERKLPGNVERNANRGNQTHNDEYCRAIPHFVLAHMIIGRSGVPARIECADLPVGLLDRSDKQRGVLGLDDHATVSPAASSRHTGESPVHSQ